MLHWLQIVGSLPTISWKIQIVQIFNELHLMTKIVGKLLTISNCCL